MRGDQGEKEAAEAGDSTGLVLLSVCRRRHAPQRTPPLLRRRFRALACRSSLRGYNPFLGSLYRLRPTSPRREQRMGWGGVIHEGWGGVIFERWGGVRGGAILWGVIHEGWAGVILWGGVRGRVILSPEARAGDHEAPKRLICSGNDQPSQRIRM